MQSFFIPYGYVACSIMMADDGITRLQLVVAPDPVSIKALQYVLDNLDSLRVLGVKFTVLRVPTEKDKLAPLVKRGITNTPTLVMPDGKLMIGLDSIRRVIDKNVSKVTAERTRRPPPDNGFTRTGDEVNDWMTANILQGAPRGRAGRIAQPEADEDEGPYRRGSNEGGDEEESISASSDFSSRMASFESRRNAAMPPDPFGNDRGGPARRRRPNNNARATDDGDDGDGHVRRNVGNMIDDGSDFNNTPSMSRRGAPPQPPRRRTGRDTSASDMDRMMEEALMERATPSPYDI